MKFALLVATLWVFSIIAGAAINALTGYSPLAFVAGFSIPMSVTILAVIDRLARRGEQTR